MPAQPRANPTAWMSQTTIGRVGCLNTSLQFHWSDHEEDDERGTALEDDAAALDYACRMIRELIASGGYDDPRLVVKVRNEMHQIVLSVPFLAACA